MKDREIKNLPASIKSRLMTLARGENRPFDEMLKYYAIERFLYRLSRSEYKDKFLLKGALLFQAWGISTFRPTRDIDFLGYTDNQVETLVKVVREICGKAVVPDGMVFDLTSVRGERITEDADYEGVRVRFQGHLGKTRVPLQMDVGFADVVSPSPTHLKYPALLDLPASELRAYPAETVVAEKLQAMVVLGMINSRMKDFYDLLIMANHFAFKGSSLQKAIMRTFQKRKTSIPGNLPALTGQFAQEKQEQWQAFMSRNLLKDAPARFAEALRLLRTFLLPILEACTNDRIFDRTWNIKGYWD